MPTMRSWPHAPSKSVTAPGIYMVTAGTYHKRRLFHDDARLEILHDMLLDFAEADGWDLMAWAVFANHYHFVGSSPQMESPVTRLCSKLHTLSAKRLNEIDSAPGREVWYRFFDTRLTFEKSVMARLAYVHNNPAKHGVVQTPEDYPWCSASWFDQQGDKSFVESVKTFKTDTVNVYDDF